MDTSEIETLISRAALGDRLAFSTLYDRTSGKLFGVCVRILKNRAAAEDALQDVFVKIWKNADRYQVTGQGPMPWLITIARNTSIDRIRASKPETDISTYAEVLPSAGLTPEQSAVAGSEAARLAACLDTLDEDRRNAITGAYLNGETYNQLSERFSVPLNTMRTWLRRGLISLRECMSHDG